MTIQFDIHIVAAPQMQFVFKHFLAGGREGLVIFISV